MTYQNESALPFFDHVLNWTARRSSSNGIRMAEKASHKGHKDREAK
jgi:hypothetical protein